MLSSVSNDFLRALSWLFGWIYTFSWGLSFYPQLLLNIRRRSTSGTTPSFPILNVVGFLSYTITTSAFYSSSVIRRQYRERHSGEDNTVRANDIAFAAHSLVISLVAVSQFWSPLWHFERRRWGVGTFVWGIIFASVIGVLVTIGMIVTEVRGTSKGWEWLDVIYAIGYVKLLVTLVKYSPQAYVNYMRKSTVGWSILPVLMDLLGGVLSVAQLIIDSSLQKDWSGLTGNPVKLGIGNASIVFDILFILQHYILYPVSKDQDKVAQQREQEVLLGEEL